MATATLTALLTDILLDNASAPTGFGSSNSEFVETVLQRQGSNCASNGHNSTLGPTTLVGATPTDWCGSYWTVTQNISGLHLHVWLRGMYPLRSQALGGLAILVTDGTNEGLWFISGSDLGYSGNWLHGVVDCSKAFDLTSGTAPTLTAITQIGGCYNIEATKGADILYPFFFDSIRKENGSGQNGIRILGGITGDRLLLSDLPVGDETLRTGIVRISDGNVFCDGEWHFGNAASTMYFQDTLADVTFANIPVAVDYYKIIFNDGTTGVTSFTHSSSKWKGVSRAIPFDFDASALATGDECVLTSITFLFGRTITFGAQSTIDACTFIECVTVVPNGITLTTPNFSNCDAITLTTASDKISGGSTSLHNTATGIDYILTNDLAKIENHAFDNTSGTGHAIELNTTGTYTFTGNTFAGYGADASTNAAIYNNSGGAVTINIAGGGDTPTVRNGAGASTTVVAGAVTTAIKTVDTDGANVASVRVILRAATGGGLPFQDTVTITRAGTVATVAHTGHGMKVGDKFDLDGITDKTGDNTVQTIATVPDANSYTYTTTNSGSTSYTGTITSTFVVLEGLTDASGDISASRVYGASQPVAGQARKSTSAPFFKSAGIPGTISTTAGYSQTVTMISDE